MKTSLGTTASILTVAAVASCAFAGTATAAPVFGASNFAGGNWGGYVSFGSFTTATAGWIEPSVTCNSTDDLFAPWVGIDGDGSSTVEQAGVSTDCAGGSPVYRAWYELYPAPPVYYDNPVSAGDKITATVSRTGTSTYKIAISDTTKGWTQSVTKSLSAKHSSAEAVIESPTDSYPTINGGVTFTGVEFNGAPLATASPSAVDADDRGAYTWSPSAIAADGTDFTMTRH